MRNLTAATLLLCAAAAAPVPAQQTVLKLDPAQTRVEFTLHDVLHTVHGTFKLKSGSIRFDPAGGAATGGWIVDARSGDSGSGARDGRMHKNILESERYPEIAFIPDRVGGKVSLDGTSQVQVHGIFKIHGADHELTLPVQAQFTPGHGTATTHFEVPYVKWGMKNPSTLFLRVSDSVEISIRAVGTVSAE